MAPGAVSIDRMHHVYVSDKKNNIYKLDPAGKLLYTFSPIQQGHLASLEAWNMVRILAFYDDQQQFTLLDRFLTPLATTRLSDITDGIIRAATLASDERIWLLNESEFSLLKLDTRYPDAALRTQLNLILNKKQYDIRFMREYQNNLYLLDRLSGIYIFDNMGNYKKKIPVSGISYLGFQGEEVYFVKDNQLIFTHLYTLKESSVPLPAIKLYQKALVGDKLIYLFFDQGLDIYQYK